MAWIMLTPRAAILLDTMIIVRHVRCQSLYGAVTAFAITMRSHFAIHS